MGGTMLSLMHSSGLACFHRGSCSRIRREQAPRRLSADSLMRTSEMRGPGDVSCVSCGNLRQALPVRMRSRVQARTHSSAVQEVSALSRGVQRCARGPGRDRPRPSLPARVRTCAMGVQPPCAALDQLPHARCPHTNTSARCAHKCALTQAHPDINTRTHSYTHTNKHLNDIPSAHTHTHTHVRTVLTPGV